MTGPGFRELLVKPTWLDLVLVLFANGFILFRIVHEWLIVNNKHLIKNDQKASSNSFFLFCIALTPKIWKSGMNSFQVFIQFKCPDERISPPSAKCCVGTSESQHTLQRTIAMHFEFMKR